MSTLKKLLKYPHSAVFDVSPDSALAFRIRKSGLFSWSADDEYLTLTDGTETIIYTLSELTIGQLIAQLIDDGFTVDGISPEFAGRSALVLANSSGTETGDLAGQFWGFRSLLWVLFSAYSKEISKAKQQVGEAIRQMVTTQAEGEWLDEHGAMYNAPRRDGQQDANYAQYIPREAFRARVNALAIENAVFDETGKSITIEEPWRLMFRLSEGRLGGPQRFYDGESIGPCLISPVSASPIDWRDVLQVINRNKAAGVIVLEPVVLPVGSASGFFDGVVDSSMSEVRGDMALMDGESRLNFIQLSDEYRLTRNYPTLISISSTHGSSDAATPVEASGRTFQFTGATWLYAKEWGAFAWNSDITNDDVSLAPSANISLAEIEVWE